MSIAKYFQHLRPHAFTSHRKRTRRYFLNHDMPYPLDCAVLGHKPVWIALSTNPGRRDDGFMECARCTLRPILTETAQRYTKPDRRTETRAFIERAISDGEVYWHPRRAESHLEIGSRFVDRFAFEVSIGTAGSETPLDAYLIIPGFRGFYVGTSVLGTRVAHWRSRHRRAKGLYEYETAEYGFSIDKSRVRWSLGAAKGGRMRGGPEPKWRNGSWDFGDFLLGKVKVQHEKLSTHAALIPMPEGLYPATITLERWTRTRRTWRQPRVQHAADFRIEGGVPNGREKYGDWDATIGFGIRIDDPTGEGWIPSAEIAASRELLKTREGYLGRADWDIPEGARNPRVIPHKVAQA